MDIFEHYRRLCDDSDVFSESNGHGAGASSHSSTYRLRPQFGSGWMDMALLGRGMVVGRAAYAFNTPCRQTYAESPESLSINIVVAGRVHLQHANEGVQSVGGDTLCLWQRGAHAQPLTYDLRAGDSMQGVSIDLPLPFAQDLLHGAGGRSTSGLLGSLLRKAPAAPVYARLDRQPCSLAAHTLLHTPAASTVDRLKLESAALTLLAELIGADQQAEQGRGASSTLPRRHRNAVDDAISILRAEFAQPHTIASLARRVGLNECYLKSAFRIQTGATFATYLRDLRMRHALALIESGRHRIHDVAQFVGYANPSHFAAAFRKIHGVPPSCVR